MALLQWTSQLSLNIKEVDLQHMKLVDLVNELDQAMRSGRGKDVVGKVLDRLVDYTSYHFGAEERLMEKHAYTGLERHKQEHVAFVKKVVDFRSGYAQGKSGLSINVMTFLSDWLVSHIKGTDRQYAPHMASKGVS